MTELGVGGEGEMGGCADQYWGVGGRWREGQRERLTSVWRWNN